MVIVSGVLALVASTLYITQTKRPFWMAMVVVIGVPTFTAILEMIRP